MDGEPCGFPWSNEANKQEGRTLSEQSNGEGTSSHSSQQSKSGLYGDAWVPSPDDPNYAAYLKYQQNLQQTTKGSQSAASGKAATSSSPAGASYGAASSKGFNSEGGSREGTPSSAPGGPRFDSKGRPVSSDRPQQDNPNADPSDYFMGPLAKPSHWSDKPNPDAPWWANPYTYVSKGEWRKPNWGGQDGPQDVSGDASGESSATTSAEGREFGNQAHSSQDVVQNETSSAASGSFPSSDSASGGTSDASSSPIDDGQARGAWVPTGVGENPWQWDATAIPNQTIDGKPCCVPAGAWVPSGNPSAPWRWDSSVLPNQYLEGKPVRMPEVSGSAPTGRAEPSGAVPNAQSVWAGIPDLSKETGEDRPDVPRATRIGWFFIGLVGGFLGLVFAWMVGSKYPQKQRRQVVRWCWAGFFCWCLLMFVIMGINANGGFASFGTGGESASVTGSAPSSGSGGAFD